MNIVFTLLPPKWNDNFLLKILAKVIVEARHAIKPFRIGHGKSNWFEFNDI